MKELRGRLALVTGASRGLGEAFARALVAEGMRVLIAARSTHALERIAQELRAQGAEVHTHAGDLAVAADRASLVAYAERELGGVDLLVNNAGIEATGAYERLSAQEIERMLTVNVSAPMLLAHALLPGMLKRGRGHILNVASLAGLAATAYGEPYSATKHAMVGFTRSLRATSQVSDKCVSASALCPGYVSEVGMYAQMEREHDAKAKGAIGTVTPAKVIDAAIRGIKKDQGEIIVATGPMRPMLALGLLFPRFSEWAARKLGAHKVFEAAAQSKGLGREPTTPSHERE